MIILLLACAGADLPGRIAVDPPDSGLSATVWVQGNIDFVSGAQVCLEDYCTQTREDGFADLFDLPEGLLSIRVDNPDGDNLLIPIDLYRNYMPNWSVRSFSPDVLPFWLGAQQAETGVIMVVPINVERDTESLVGATLTSSVGSVVTVHDYERAVPENQAKEESIFFLSDIPPGEVELSVTPKGACVTNSMGWPGSDADSFVVPVEAGRVTVVNLKCVDF